MRRLAILTAAALTAVACTSPGGTARDPGYFEGLRPVAIEVTSAIAEVGAVFDGAYESTSMRATRLTDLRAGADLAIAADRADRLTPGSAYREDHERYLALIDEIRELFRSFDSAVAADDTAVAAAVATAMEAAAGLGFASLSPEFCAEVTFDMRLCLLPPAGEYAAALHRAYSELAAGYTPLLRADPPALTGEEAERYRESIDPQAASLLRAIASRLAGTEPTTDFAGDHRAVLAVLEQAAAAHDGGAGPGSALAALCDARASLSEPGMEIAEVLFEDDDLSCEG